MKLSSLIPVLPCFLACTLLSSCDDGSCDVTCECVCEVEGGCGASDTAEIPQGGDDTCGDLCARLDECSWLDQSSEWGVDQSDCESWCVEQYGGEMVAMSIWECAASALLECDRDTVSACLEAPSSR